MSSTTFVQLTREQLNETIQRAAQIGAERTISGLKGTARHLLASTQGIADKATLAEIYDTSVSTIERWDARHSFRRVDGPDKRRVWFDLEDVAEKVKESE